MPLSIESVLVVAVIRSERLELLAGAGAGVEFWSAAPMWWLIFGGGDMVMARCGVGSEVHEISDTIEANPIESRL